MKLKELRSKINLYGIHPTPKGLNEVIEDIEKYANDIFDKRTSLRSTVSCNEIMNGPYWERRKQLSK